MEDTRFLCPKCASAVPAGAKSCLNCGYIMPEEVASAAPAEPPTATPLPQSNVVYVQPMPVDQRESNWGAWLAVVVIVLIAGIGFVLWGTGVIGEQSSSAASPANVSIENSPQMSTEQQAEAPEPAPAPAESPEPPAASPAVIPATPPAIDIISVEGQVRAKFSTEWRYGYTVRLRNNTDRPVITNVRIQFLDVDGYPVDDDVLEDLYIPANTEMTFDGDDMIDVELAERVNSLLAVQR